MKTLTRLAIAVAVCALSAPVSHAQMLGSLTTLFVPIETLGPDAGYQDHERLPVGEATTPVGAPSHGWIIGRTLLASTRLGGADGHGFGGGKALVILGGRPWVQVAGGPMDDIPAGSGYAASFVVPVSEIQFEVITDLPLDIDIEAFFLHKSLAPAQRFTVAPGDNVLRLGSNGVFWDAIQVRAVKDGPGWGLDNVGVAGKMLAREVVCRALSASP